MSGEDFLWEYTLHGAISGPAHALQTRLNGIGAGAPHAAQSVRMHEQVFRADKATKTGGTVHLHARHDLENNSWQLVYFGPLVTQHKDESGVMSRPVRIVKSGSNPGPFIEDMGFRYCHEIVRQGQRYCLEDDISVSITRISKTTERGNLETAQPVDEAYLVEAMCMATAAQKKEKGKLMQNLAQSLKPLVLLSRLEAKDLR